MNNRDFARNLEERTKQFALLILRLSSTMPKSAEALVVRNQITKSGTSVGANYREANRARSRAETMKKIASDVILGQNVQLNDFINLYGCTIGDGTKIGPFVEIQKNAVIGRNCKIQSHTFICEGVTIEDEVFVGHGVMFINDRFPRATTADGGLQTEADWAVVPTLIEKRASIGSNATILCGLTIGEGAVVGAGSVVTKDVAPNTTVAGNPARVLKKHV